MKKIALLLALLGLAALLAGCSAPAEDAPQTEESAQTEQNNDAEQADDSGFVGTWVGDGTMDIMGLDHEIEFVHTWIFREDGTVTAEKTVNGAEETLEFEYKYTDDTLTFVQGDATCGIGYVLEGDTLTFRTGVNTFAEYIRQ